MRGHARLTRLCQTDKQMTNGAVEAKQGMGFPHPCPVGLGTVSLHGSLTDHASVRLRFPAWLARSKATEGHLPLTENVLCEQHWNLMKLPDTDRRTGRPCFIRGSGGVVIPKSNGTQRP